MGGWVGRGGGREGVEGGTGKKWEREREAGKGGEKREGGEGKKGGRRERDEGERERRERRGERDEGEREREGERRRNTTKHETRIFVRDELLTAVGISLCL